MINHHGGRVTPQGDGAAGGDDAETTGVSPAVAEHRPSLSESYRRARAHRGYGGLFTESVNDRLGSSVAALGISLGVHPTLITLTDFALALVASVVVIAGTDQAHSWWVPGIMAFVLWQLAYVLDCADGQVARATGKRSDFGARVDVLVDFSVQISILCALVSVISRFSGTSPVLLALFATTWLTGMITFLLGRADGNLGHSFTTSNRGLVGVIKLVRDDGLALFVIGGWLMVAPETVIIPFTLFSLVNIAFLLASIAREAWLSIRKA